MLKWELYKRFLERFKNIAFFRDMSVQGAAVCYILAKISQGMITYGAAWAFRDYRYINFICLVLMILYFAIDLRAGYEKVKTVIQQNHSIEFYKCNSLYNEKEIIRNIALAELLWDGADTLAVYVPIMYLLFQKHGFKIWEAVLLLLLLIFIMAVKFIFLQLTIQSIYYGRKSQNNIFSVMKLISFCVFVWVGTCISDMIVSCPLQSNKNVVNALKQWIKTFRDVSFVPTKNTVSAVILFCIVVLVWRLFNTITKSNYKYKLYNDSKIESRDFGLLPVFFGGLISGILYGKGACYNNITMMLSILMVTYTVSWIFDDICALHDELAIDSDSYKLLLWNHHFQDLLKYKLKLFVNGYMIKLLILYALVQGCISTNAADIWMGFHNLLIACLFLLIGFMRKSRAIVNSPTHVSEDYSKVKYEGERIIENDTIGLELLILAVIIAIPSILHACQEITFDVYIILQFLCDAAIIGGIVWNYMVLRKDLNKQEWLIKLFG